MCTSNATAINNWSTGIGAAGQLIGGLMGASANQGYHDANARYLEQMNELNQIQAESAVNSVQYAGGMQASAVRNKGVSLTKTQKAAMASHGLSHSTTYQNILDDSITRSERDAMAILYNSDIQAKNIRTNAALQQAQMLSQAAQERAAGKIAKRAGVLSTIGQFADTWTKWSQTGMAGYGSSKSSSGAHGGFIPKTNTNFYTGNSNIDWDKNRWSIKNNIGFSSGGSVWGGGF